GGADPTLTYTVSGLENNDQATVVTGSLSRIAGESVNTYAINQGTIQASANYTLVFNPADFIITPALLTLTAEAKTKVYGDVDPALSYTVSGLENNDQATVVTGSLSRIAGESVNTYAINQGTLEASANYTLVFNPADFTITPALLSLAAEAKTKVYGDADPALTYRVSGLKLNDQATVVTGSLLRIAGESVNTYAINQGTLEASANYTLAFNAATFTITPALLTVNAEAKTKVYGDADPALTYTVSGLKNNDQATVVTGSLSRIAGESVNTYAINQGTLEASANYTLAFNPADFTITPALLTLTAEAKTKVYGDADPALTYTVSGLKNNDQITAILTGNLARIAGESVNTYPIHQGTLVASVNYTIVFQAGELTITPAELRLYPLVGQQKVYGQVDPMFQFTALGFKYSDTATTALTGGLGRRAGENVNLYVYTLGSLEALSSNYTLTISNQEKFEIKPAPLHIVVNPSQFKNYGAVDPAFTYTANGLQQGDYLIQAVAGNLSRRAGEEVGMYPLERGTLTPRANYYLASFVGANFEIKRAKINGLTLPSQTFVYDGQQKQLQIEGTLIPEATVTYTNNNQSQVGRYRVTALVNYGPSYEPLTLEGILTLTKANQQITWDELGQVVMEDTPTLQLEARASSSLAVSYTIDDPQDREVAEVDASGVVRFLQPGLVTITAHQTGDVNYNPAKSVSQFIEVTSRDASIWDLLVDGVSYGKIEKEFHLIIGCESQQEEIILAIKTQVGAEISPSNKITIPLTTYGKYEQVITVKSQNGQVIETYTIHIDKRIPTENIVFQKYENVLLVNNNKQTNGGYVFIAYQWFKNGVPIGEKQMYSAGDNLGETLDFGAEYQVELTLYNGTKLRSCPIVLGDKTQGNWAVYPNPVKKNQLLHVRVDETKQQTTNYVIYNVKGQTIKRGVLEIGNTGIEIPANVAAGSYFLVLKIEGKQQSVQFIVRE
uniref:MBG domain-containing protein n=1 Tax=Myroides odoratus TaxID=256 RepID=UPI0039AF109A